MTEHTWTGVDSETGTFDSEGEKQISLKIKDSNGIWSDIKELTINVLPADPQEMESAIATLEAGDEQPKQTAKRGRTAAKK